jgi:hypothetical protein
MPLDLLRLIGQILAEAADAAPQSVVVESRRPYFTRWFTLAMINTSLAESKHVSGLNWYLISLRLDPIATLVLVAFCDPPV